MFPLNQIVYLYVPTVIKEWTHGFVRDDSVSVPLDVPYTVTFVFLSSLSNTFKLDINGPAGIVSVDRLKKEFQECESSSSRVSVTYLFNLLQSPVHTPSQTPTTQSAPTTSHTSTTIASSTALLYIAWWECPVNWPRKHFKIVYL